MASSKAASRKRRNKFKKKHPYIGHNFSKWEYGEVVCRGCGMDTFRYEGLKYRGKRIPSCVMSR